MKDAEGEQGGRSLDGCDAADKVESLRLSLTQAVDAEARAALRLAELKQERDDLRAQVEARSSWPAPEASEIVGEMRERARVGREIVALAKGLMDVPGAGVLPFCLSDIGSRLEAGLSVEDWSPVVDADATERGEHEEAPDAG